MCRYVPDNIPIFSLSHNDLLKKLVDVQSRIDAEEVNTPFLKTELKRYVDYFEHRFNQKMTRKLIYECAYLVF